MNRCIVCNTYGQGDVCSDRCDQSLRIHECEASGHPVQGDYCYCGMVAAPGVC